MCIYVVLSWRAGNCMIAWLTKFQKYLQILSLLHNNMLSTITLTGVGPCTVLADSESVHTAS